MDALDYWRLCHELTVVQAALLIVGEDPAGQEEHVDRNEPQNRPRGYDAAKTALINAIESNQLRATIVTNIDGALVACTTRIGVEDLRDWLKSRKVATGFFFPTLEVGPDYLSQDHPHYCKKLAAAVEAWRAVSADAELRRGKSVKRALVLWLRQHGKEFGLTKGDGTPNEQGIQEIAKIANWDPQGGAPKSPGNP